MSTQPAANAGAQTLYASAPKIYARYVKGTFARLRRLSTLGLLGIYYIIPWLTWGDRPLVLLDLPARRFHILGLTLVPQDLFLLTGMLIIAAMTLFLFTSLAGRLWCGFACPQTVWTNAFMWMERMVEGNRHARMKLDKKKWGAEKLLRKLAKHVLWFAFAFWTGITFVGFFVPITELVPQLFAGTLGGWALFWVIFYAFATWGNAGFMREQVCRYMCPYARFQSAMFDKDTLIISYDALRGEPRKSRVKKGDDQNAGDCVACNMCVQVCPTGIDIRDGLQYECIACAACIDACDSVMDHVGKPRGLVRYSTAHQDAGGKTHILRGRTIGYAVVWLAVVIGFALVLLNRSTMELDVIRDRHAMSRNVGDGLVENIYTVKLTNKSDFPRDAVLSAVDDSGNPITLSANRFTVAPFATTREVISVRARTEPGRPTMGLNFHAHWVEDPEQSADAQARFIGRNR